MQFPISLVCHPETPPPPGVAVRAFLEIDDDALLAVDFQIVDEFSNLLVPPPTAPGPADGLWRHTCCEVFVAGRGGEAYREINLSPDGRWAAYAFDRYRERQAEFAPPPPAGLIATQSDLCIDIGALLPMSWLPASPAWDFGLSAVLETRQGAFSYWALAHPGPRPDFHDRRSFILSGPSPVPGSPSP